MVCLPMYPLTPIWRVQSGVDKSLSGVSDRLCLSAVLPSLQSLAVGTTEKPHDIRLTITFHPTSESDFKLQIEKANNVLAQKATNPDLIKHFNTSSDATPGIRYTYEDFIA